MQYAVGVRRLADAYTLNLVFVAIRSIERTRVTLRDMPDSIGHRSPNVRTSAIVGLTGDAMEDKAWFGLDEE